MLDFNSTASLSGRLTALIDVGIQAEKDKEEGRKYLGASRLGVACERALQYEYAQVPVDYGREIDGRLCRIFKRGHVTEDCMATWLRDAGFDVRTADHAGAQFGFSVLDGRLQGHVDGVIVRGPSSFAYPCLWENKCLGAKSWRDLEKNRLAIAKPIYAVQVAVYQAYLQLHEHPALFTAVNADTMDIYAELVPFNAALAQQMSDRAAKVIRATGAGELLPRSFSDKTHFECRVCGWQDRCWRMG